MELIKLMFLDIDGVLNSETFYKNKSEQELFKEEGYPLCEIDPSAIEKINKIIRQTKAKVVISSSWRLGRSIQNLQDIFNKKGFIGTIDDITPHLRYIGNDNTVPRGCEIETYLNDNFEYDIKTNIKYVIIDDDIDMLFYQKDHFLHTTEYDGITDIIVAKAINLLNN